MFYRTNLPRKERDDHGAARIGDSILVLGGRYSSTAEIVPGAAVIQVIFSYSSLLTGFGAGSGGEFQLQHKDSFAACAIAVEDTREVVLIGGGRPSHGHVSR